jgi:PEP-CTERM motif
MYAERFLKKKKTTETRQILSLLILVVVIPALWFWLSPSTKCSLVSCPSSLTSVSGVSQISLNKAFSESKVPAPFASSGALEVFPYSVIPGGIRSARDLQQAARHEALVARHYSGFHFESTRVIHALKDKKVYVSYRVGGQIFWTRRKVTIHAGETLLTDGHNLARGRCGNRISESPKSPGSPDEPSDSTMSTALVFPDAAPLGFLVADVSLPLALLPPQTSFPPSDNMPPDGSFPPIFLPLFVGPRSPSDPFPPAVPPIVSAPEPGSLLLAVLGLGALAFLRLRRII